MWISISIKHFFQFVYNSTTKISITCSCLGWRGRNCTQDDRSQDKGAAFNRQSPAIHQILPVHQNSSSERMVDGGGLLHHTHSEFVKKTFPNALN